ncbi:bifunctional proline dehydrogenase/L-glutamate gamma-semialdehyde dehydrogenase PutA [Sphingomonas sp. BK235]|uniref:bifunctional proline dehydrogenase/L-glutamate gamma-semialdehyde dehydrogenase PutA n=1 Tax=Sphingomonas sp. BK235 TaxID=2512131 RepID=UPI0010462AF6|nr:bifunctional proline dehydrogenase/L-glutamate gamma-semialdehyde dehydrogenase PutA [Sphingomonas sp. BK235]TCP31022.1 L-proline dehydrogenase /delta-1-pyrroline-5-carboxylate dehydrogenase [Sphingomonas sp. BK235]
MSSAPLPFAAFAPPIAAPRPSRLAITAATRLPERTCLPPLLDAATLPADTARAVRDTATVLVETLRARGPEDGIAALVREYALSSDEGVALMCLAEALLRIPDAATRDALIRDKIAPGDWRAHVGDGRSLFVNAATWGLAVTGRLSAVTDQRGLGAALTRVVARAGAPVIRRGIDTAMRMMGERFVTGETIAEALQRARPLEARGFRYSYDMLGEAATTADDAARYFADYTAAIQAIGRAADGRGPYEGPGISIKLSALHPRYARSQAERVMAELLPRVKSLAVLAKRFDIGLNIDAEEANRLELSLDLLEALARDTELAGWDGLGFVVQAYGRRCPMVIDWIVDLARDSGRRIMVRLVKGAYWDAEIKRAQVDGQADFPVYTRKIHTDVAYLACARRLLVARDRVFPQFATHNAQTVAAIFHMAGGTASAQDYEFQCLHGMGEPLYEAVVGAGGLDRPCRIYAPVGTHETLLAYLVRRLLENGANSSFVNRLADPAVPVSDLAADPVETVRAMPDPGAPHPAVLLPRDLYGARSNSAGLDLADEGVLAALGEAMRASARERWRAAPTGGGQARDVPNPADHRDIVGVVEEIAPARAAALATEATAAAARWAAVPVDARAACLERAADLMEARTPALLGLIVREAGKSVANASAEVREAVDFLRYYAAEARRVLGPDHRPLGPITCISPWNFPLAIFTGQVAAALVAGNPVLAKPAEETPLIAAQGVAILHEAGVPADVLHLVPGDGAVGAVLVAAPETAAVMFTGSTEVARLIQRQLAGRLGPDGRPVPLVAETGGQNAMVVDSSALAEQVVGDVIASAFDSAGQRCSALRVLCLQEDIADRLLAMLKGALAELSVGNTDRLRVDIGPVISAEARDGIERHVAAMQARGRPVHRLPLAPDAAHGTFVAPTIVELDGIADLEREVFGPVLHIVRYRRTDLPALIDAINATGYGLTFGLHTRLDETVATVLPRVHAGNLYVNRNVIGAVVGVQPFGGRGLSGTGPKAGGPLYFGRLVDGPPLPVAGAKAGSDPAHAAYLAWLDRRDPALAATMRAAAGWVPCAEDVELTGPVGERNLYGHRPRGRILLLPETEAGLLEQLNAVLATGNCAAISADPALRRALDDLPPAVAARLAWVDARQEGACAGALIEGSAERRLAALGRIAAQPGAILLPQVAPYRPDWLVEEVSTSINTTAAGGNASLMTRV